MLRCIHDMLRYIHDMFRCIHDMLGFLDAIFGLFQNIFGIYTFPFTLHNFVRNKFYICSVMLKIKKYVAYILLFVMTAYSIPKELLHELHHHTDTVDSSYKANASKEINTKHTHCNAFNFDGPVLFYSFYVFNFEDDATYFPFVIASIEPYFIHSLHEHFQRGPPNIYLG